MRSEELAVSYSNPLPSKHGTRTLGHIRNDRYSAEWWHSRYQLTGDLGDYDHYLEACSRLQESRQYCTEYTQRGGM